MKKKKVSVLGKREGMKEEVRLGKYEDCGEKPTGPGSRKAQGKGGKKVQGNKLLQKLDEFGRLESLGRATEKHDRIWGLRKLRKQKQ